MYAQAESALGRYARVSGGIRGDHVTTKNVGGFFGDRSTSNAAASGFGAVTVGPFQGFSVTAQVSRGFRDPVLSDRYFRGPSGRGFITGNPDLEPETSLQFDLATRYTLARTQLGVSTSTSTGSTISSSGIRRRPISSSSATAAARALRGFEVEARSDLGRGYSVEVGAQVARGRALDDNANLDDISPVTFSVLGRKEFGDRVYAQARARVSTRRTIVRVRARSPRRARRSSTSAPAGGSLRSSELRGQLRNLLDDDVLRQSRSALRARARPLGQPDGSRAVLDPPSSRRSRSARLLRYD